MPRIFRSRSEFPKHPIFFGKRYEFHGSHSDLNATKSIIKEFKRVMKNNGVNYSSHIAVFWVKSPNMTKPQKVYASYVRRIRRKN